MARVWMVLVTGAALSAGCSSPRVAARLAAVTSGHVNTLNTELAQYVNAANASRQADARRVAAAQSRWDQDNAYIQPFLTQWRIDRKSSLTDAFAALQEQSNAELTITDNYLKRQNDAAAQLAGSYGQLSYSPAQLEGVIAALQKLVDRSGPEQQITIIRDFARNTLDDTRKQLQESQLNPAGEISAGGAQ